MEERIQVSFSTDDEGFISQQCPSCSRRFKIRVDDESNQTVNHCPYCGSPSEDGWLTEEQRAYAMGVVTQQAIDPILERFSRGLNRLNRPGSLITVSGRYEKTVPPSKPVETGEPMPLFTPPCCNEPVKHDGSTLHLFCVVCGCRPSAD